MAINCSAIPEPLLESELFGHEQGAFTGADKKRIGKFEQCNGGTLFLDEVGDMTPLTQTKILRLVQEQRFERVGGNETIQTNVRLIAATNKNLEKLVAEGKFRQDLYYRLSVFAIKLPPLRERMDDLPLLVNYFLRRYAREMDKNMNGNRSGGTGSLEALLLAGQHPRVAERDPACVAGGFRVGDRARILAGHVCAWKPRPGSPRPRSRHRHFMIWTTLSMKAWSTAGGALFPLAKHDGPAFVPARPGPHAGEHLAGRQDPGHPSGHLAHQNRRPRARRGRTQNAARSALTQDCPPAKR